MTDYSSPRMPRWKAKRVKTPTIIQMEAVECGAAALGMVLGYFGRFEALEKLREECGVSRDGSKASNVLKAARRFGLQAKGLRLGLEDLQDLPLPLIIFWNFNHFLVLEGTKGDKVYLNDPAKGPRTVSLEEFDEAFTGIALSLQPGPDFQPGGKKPGVLPLVKKRLAGSRTTLIFTMICALFMVVPGLVIPIFSQVFIDHVIMEGMAGWFRPLLLAMLAAALLQASLSYIQSYYLLRLETKLALSGTTAFVRRILSLPVSFFFQRMAGDLTNRTKLNDSVAKVISQQVAPNLMNLIMVGFYLAVMVLYDWLLSGVSVIMAGLNLLALRLVSRRKTDLSQKMLNEKNKLMGQAMTGLQLIETLKASGSESDFFSRWAGYQAKALNATQEFSRTNQYLLAVPPMLTAVNSALILGIGGFRIVAGDLTIGQLVAFQFLVGVFMKPVIRLVNMGNTLQNTFADMNQLDDVLRYEPDPMVSDPLHQEEIPEETPLKLSGRLEMKNIAFGYSKLEPPLIEAFDLRLTPGSRVALVGGSGSGKSTIAKLAGGLYQPWEGEIRYDDIPLTRLHRDTFTRSVSTVDQDVMLFDGTIRSNLTMWDETVPEEDVIRAARDAQIYEDITRRTNGLDSVVKEDGHNFSGGQCQRLEIARALTRNPSLLIMDEATSALDPQTEKLVDEAVRRRGCTCLIIAHRLSTIRDADEIIVLKNGQVVERGNHDELKANDGFYSELIASP